MSACRASISARRPAPDGFCCIAPIVIDAMATANAAATTYLVIRIRPSVLETDSDAAVDVSALERRPRIHGPAAIRRARRTNQRIPLRLPHAREVLAVDK